MPYLSANSRISPTMAKATLGTRSDYGQLVVEGPSYLRGVEADERKKARSEKGAKHPLKGPVKRVFQTLLVSTRIQSGLSVCRYKCLVPNKF